MKTFKQHIAEEWIDNTRKLGDVFKNPTPTEMREHLRGAGTDLAGILLGKDIYVFDGMHDYAVKALDRLGINTTKHVRFRGLVRRGKISQLGPSGGTPSYMYAATATSRKKIFTNMATIYNHASMKRFMDSPDESFRIIVSNVFSKSSTHSELQALSKRHKIVMSPPVIPKAITKPKPKPVTPGMTNDEMGIDIRYIADL